MKWRICSTCRMTWVRFPLIMGFFWKLKSPFFLTTDWKAYSCNFIVICNILVNWAEKMFTLPDKLMNCIDDFSVDGRMSFDVCRSVVVVVIVTSVDVQPDLPGSFDGFEIRFKLFSEICANGSDCRRIALFQKRKNIKTIVL